MFYKQEFKPGTRVTLTRRVVGDRSGKPYNCTGTVKKGPDDCGQYAVEVVPQRGQPYWVFLRAHELSRLEPKPVAVYGEPVRAAAHRAVTDGDGDTGGEWKHVVPGEGAVA